MEVHWEGEERGEVEGETSDLGEGEEGVDSRWEERLVEGVKEIS